MIRPWLLLARRRILLSLALCLVFVCFIHMWTSAEYPTDFGIFWHHFCGCPPDPDDARVLLNSFFILSFVIGLVFGPSAGNTLSANGVPAAQLTGLTRFLLTRPIPRSKALFAPLAVAILSLALIPLIAISVLLTWLYLVHAPSLGHLLALLRFLPHVAALGEHPTLPQILTAMQFGRRYLAAFSVGLCFYTIFASQRWLILNTNRKVQFAGLLPLFGLIFPSLSLFNPRVANFLLLLVPHGPLSQIPSTLAITLHFAFAAAVVLVCWRLLRKLEI